MAMRLLFLILLIAAPMSQAAQCTATSGAGTAALVELYTSEGCSSCPPADRWLASLGSRYPDGNVVPLALHVNYSVLALRQRKLSPLQRMALVYRPHVLLQGREFSGWGGQAFDAALAKINAQPARAKLRLALVAADGNGLEVEAVAELAQPSADAGLYLAAYQSRLLTHDYVVLEWQGPVAFAGKTLTERRKVPLLPGAAPANSGVAAFVQDRRTGEVLQALLRSAC